MASIKVVGFPQVQPDDTEAHSRKQPNASAIFERHAELSTARSVSGFSRAWQFFRNGTWRKYRGSVESSRRLERLIKKFGDQTHNIMWDFPDHVECLDVNKTIRELGFNDYM